MEGDLFSNILYLIPLALIIFLRAFGAGRRNAGSKERLAKEEAARQELAQRSQAGRSVPGRTADRPYPLSRSSGRGRESQDWEPHWVTEPETFGTADQESSEGYERTDPLDLEDLSRGRPGPALPKAPDTWTVPQAARSAASPIYTAPAGPAAEQGAPALSAKYSAGRPRGGLPAFLDRIPPLRRAVVLAEILGIPRGLKDS
ncbi:MAG TPA: hypothetical protein VLH39_06285 [Magnetospirillaceae bacterium]|nr:hypothetical protein [Magnetospirillaceae bacterium]